MDVRVLRVRKIFSDGRHNAFTGMAAFQQRTYLAFRSGSTHISCDGTIKVIASDDRENWQLVHEASRPGVDLRDPALAAFQDRLLVYAGGRVREGEFASYLLTSEDGRTFSEPAEITGIPRGHWLWYVKPQGGLLYGTAYVESPEGEAVALHRSRDGAAWEKSCDFPIPGNEAYIDFGADGRLWALVREDRHGSVPAVCVAEPPYERFASVTRPPVCLQGPMIQRLEGGCAIVGRSWDPPRRNIRTDLYWLADGREIQLVRTLPSGGDTSYACWLDTGPGRAVVSYYSSHEHKMDAPHANEAAFAADPAHAEHTTPADIFLADISYAA